MIKLLKIAEQLKCFAKKIELLNEVKLAPIGICEGDICNRDSCTGVIYAEEGSCTCHVGNAPCYYCTDGPLTCDMCDADAREEY